MTAFLLTTAAALVLQQRDPGFDAQEREFEPLRDALDRLERLSEPEAVFDEGIKLVAEAERFRRRHPKGTHILECLELLANAYQTIGRKWLQADKPENAEGMFRQSAAVCRELVQRTQTAWEENRDPEKEDLLERQRVFAAYLEVGAQYHLALALSQQEGKEEALRTHVLEMDAAFQRFMLSYDVFIWALDAATYMARSLELLARSIGKKNVVEAIRLWEQAFRHFSKGRNLIFNQEWRDVEEVETIALRATHREIVARLAYVELLREIGIPYRRELQRIADLAEEIFTAYPSGKRTPAGREILREVEAIRKRLASGDGR